MHTKLTVASKTVSTSAIINITHVTQTHEHTHIVAAESTPWARLCPVSADHGGRGALLWGLLADLSPPVHPEDSQSMSFPEQLARALNLSDCGDFPSQGFQRPWC